MVEGEVEVRGEEGEERPAPDEKNKKVVSGAAL
jgi:hypothetical protein